MPEIKLAANMRCLREIYDYSPYSSIDSSLRTVNALAPEKTASGHAL